MATSTDALMALQDASSASNMALNGERAAEHARRGSVPTQWAYRERFVDKDPAQGLGLDVAPDGAVGLEVLGVVPGSAAERAGGWRAGDLIVMVNGEVVHGQEPEAKVAALLAASGRVRLGVMTRAYNTDGTLTGSSTEHVATEYFFDDGVITKDDGGGFGLDIAVEDEEGAIITHIVPGGAADRAGFMRANDRIVKINDKTIVGLSLNEVVDRLRSLNGPVKFAILAANPGHPRHRDEVDLAHSAAAVSQPPASASGAGCVVS